MRIIRRSTGLVSVVFLSACASAPTSTLMPDDVPVLYEAPDPSLVSVSICDDLTYEYERLNTGLGEDPVETPSENRRTLEERLNKRARSFFRSELNRQLGGTLDVVDFLTDKKETERLRAVGKKRGMIRRAYIMGYMDARACNTDDGPEVELQMVSADGLPSDLPDGMVETLVLAEAFSVEPELIPAAADANAPADSGEAPRFAIAIDYVVADEAMVQAVKSKYYLPGADEVDAAGMWPRPEALIYLDARSEERGRKRRLPSPDDVGADGLWPPVGTPGYE